MVNSFNLITRRRTNIIKISHHHLKPFIFNLRSCFKSHHTIITSNHSIPPKWLKELEIKQKNSNSITHPHQSPIVGIHHPNHRNSSHNDEIIIYESHSDHPYIQSPNRIGLSLLGLLVTTGLVANQIRHHGAGPIWTSPKSDWSDYELKLWDPSTRVLVSIGLITFTFWRCLRFVTCLSHTIKRITIKKSSLPQLKKIISLNHPTHNSHAQPIKSLTRDENVASLLDSIPVKLYSIGSIDLLYPINKLYQFSIVDSIPLNRFINLKWISHPKNPRLVSTSDGRNPNHLDSMWLKYVASDPIQGGDTRQDQGDHRDGQVELTHKNQFSSTTSSFTPSSLNSTALQIPNFGTWGNSQFGLSGSAVRSIFEHQIKSCVDLLHPPTPHDTPQGESKNGIHDVKMFYQLFGFDLRNSLWFNFNVFRSNLQLRFFT